MVSHGLTPTVLPTSNRLAIARQRNAIKPALTGLYYLVAFVLFYLPGAPVCSQGQPASSAETTNTKTFLLKVKPAQILALEDLTADQRKQIMAIKKEAHKRLLPLKQARMQSYTPIKGNPKNAADTTDRGQMGGAILGGLIDVNSDESTEKKKGEASKAIAPSNSSLPKTKSPRSSVLGQIKDVKRECLAAMLKVLTPAQRKRLSEIPLQASED